MINPVKSFLTHGPRKVDSAIHRDPSIIPQLACEAQPYIRSSLLSISRSEKERSDDRKYVCASQATPQQRERQLTTARANNYLATNGRGLGRGSQRDKLGTGSRV